MALLTTVASTEKRKSYKGTAARLFKLLCHSEDVARDYLISLQDGMDMATPPWFWWRDMLNALAEARIRAETVWETRPLIELTAEQKTHLARRREMSGVRDRSSDAT